jgi:hypothetical protein
MAVWTEPMYEAIFREHPPTQPTAPTRAECEALGRALGLSHGAVAAQWNDARSVVLDQKSAASNRLRDYLVRRGYL